MSLIFKEITFSIAEKMGVYKNTTYFSDNIGNILPVKSVRMLSNDINVITKKR